MYADHEINKKHPRGNIQITLNNILFDEVSEHTSFGFTMCNIYWSSHTSNLCTEESWVYRQILKELYLDVQKSKKTFILPNIEYGDMIFSSKDFIHLNKLSTTQCNDYLVCTLKILNYYVNWLGKPFRLESKFIKCDYFVKLWALLFLPTKSI